MPSGLMSKPLDVPKWKSAVDTSCTHMHFHRTFPSVEEIIRMQEKKKGGGSVS